MPTTEEFEVGRFYANDDIATLGGKRQMFLAITKDKQVLAGRFREDQNPLLPGVLFVGGSDERLRAAGIFRLQTEFIPVFVQPRKAPRGANKWRYEGKWRVKNRTVDAIKDDEEAQVANRKWKFDPKVSLVLHLEPEGATSDEFLGEAERLAVAEGAFDPTNVQDARDRILASIVRRRGQPEFRQKLLGVYGGRGAISDCDCVDALEAAHIQPYRGDHTNHLTNGLLLRADLHSLFDLHKISVDTLGNTVIVSQELENTVYGRFHGAKLRLPASPRHKPSVDALDVHRRRAGL